MGIRVYPTNPGPFDTHPVTVYTTSDQAHWQCACGASGTARDIADAYTSHGWHKLAAIEDAEDQAGDR